MVCIIVFKGTSLVFKVYERSPSLAHCDKTQQANLHRILIYYHQTELLTVLFVTFLFSMLIHH